MEQIVVDEKPISVNAKIDEQWETFYKIILSFILL